MPARSGTVPTALEAAGMRTRCIVYSAYDDLMLAREVQAEGAFFEHSIRLPLRLQSYVNATLPHHDRRDLTMLDRRRMASRGGRRCSDLAPVAPGA